MNVERTPGQDARREIQDLVERGKFEEALARIRKLPGDYVNEELVYPVVDIAVAFAKRGDLGKVLAVADMLGDEHIDWARWRVFREYLEPCSPERAEVAFKEHHVLIKPESKVEILLDIARCAGKENPKLARSALELALKWAGHVRGRSNRDWRLEMVLNTAWDLGQWDIVERACGEMSGRNQRTVIEDTIPPEEREGEVTTCRELAEALRKCRESSEDALDLVIEAHLRYEKELLKSRGLNPYLYKLKAVKTGEGVRFYAVRRPLTVTLAIYLLDGVRRLFAKRSS